MQAVNGSSLATKPQPKPVLRGGSEEGWKRQRMLGDTRFQPSTRSFRAEGKFNVPLVVNRADAKIIRRGALASAAWDFLKTKRGGPQSRPPDKPKP
jgi:hypothetical protein